MYSSWAVPHTGLHNTEPNQIGRFLKLTIIPLYCNARTDWLSLGETNTDPRVIQEVGSRKGDAIFTQTHTPTPTHAVFTTLRDKTTHSKCSFANRYTSSSPRLFCLIWLITVVHRPSPNTLLFLKWTWARSCFKLLFVNWETNELNCMRVSEA